MLIKLALDVNALPPVDDQWYEALRAERDRRGGPARLTVDRDRVPAGAGEGRGGGPVGVEAHRRW